MLEIPGNESLQQNLCLPYAFSYPCVLSTLSTHF